MEAKLRNPRLKGVDGDWSEALDCMCNRNNTGT